MPGDRPIGEVVIEVVSEQLEIAVSEITPESTFVTDLGADSLDTPEIIMRLEEAFVVKISDDEAQEIRTVQNAIDLITRLLAQKAGAK